MIKRGEDAQMKKRQILNKIEKIQKFIEENKSVNSKGQRITDFDKLCFIQEDLTKLQEFIKSEDKTK
jgi:hypothetical protein